MVLVAHVLALRSAELEVLQVVVRKIAVSVMHHRSAWQLGAAALILHDNPRPRDESAPPVLDADSPILVGVE